MLRVVVRFENGPEVIVSLRSDGSESVSRLLAATPFKSVASTWGDEVYFEVPFHADRGKDASADMDVGEVAFWPDGDAMAIFFGPTPASTGPNPKAYSPCNSLGHVEGDVSILRRIKPGTSLSVVSF